MFRRVFNDAKMTLIFKFVSNMCHNRRRIEGHSAITVRVSV